MIALSAMHSCKPEIQTTQSSSPLPIATINTSNAPDLIFTGELS